MVSLVDIYNIKESVFDEIKSDRDPSKGNKGKKIIHYLLVINY